LFRSGLRLRVVPRRVIVPHSAHFHAVIMRGALPRTLGRVRAWLQKFLLDRVGREILVPFHNDARIALRDYFSPPGCLSHFVSPSLSQILPANQRDATFIPRSLGCAHQSLRSLYFRPLCDTLGRTLSVHSLAHWR